VTVVGRIKRRLRPAPSRHKLEYVFVVTYGRSGSTLVQGLLNTLPRVLVRGENGLYVLQVYRACAKAMAFRELHNHHRPREVRSAFYGVRQVQRRRFVRVARTLVTETLLGAVDRDQVDVIGFKEVLWNEVEPEETEGFFAFLDSAFPGARYILNQRTHSDVASSGFWQKRDTDEVAAALERIEEIQAYLRKSRPDRVLDTRYELITSDDSEVSRSQLRALAEFVVGSCDDALMEKLRETLRTGYGPRAFGASHGRRERLQRRAARARDRG
jgi:Sulfotransferase family